MQFNVPQFIDIEDKVFGPLTFKQFAYVIGGGGAMLVFYYLLPFFVAILFMIPIATLSFLFAFKPIHGRPFAVVFESGLKYLVNKKLYLWKKGAKTPERQKKIQLAQTQSMDESTIQRVSSGKLDNMSWNLDVKK